MLIAVYDFFILYTNIPHNKLKNGTKNLNKKKKKTFQTRMQEQGSKHRFTISIMNKIFRKYFTVFNVFTETAANFIKSFQLPRITTIHIHIYLLHSLFLLFFGVFLLACLFVFCEIMLLLCLYYLSLLLHICTDLLYSYRLQVAILYNLIFF